jgi:hypothetical protein
MALRLIVCLARVYLHVQVYCPEVGAVITRIQSAEAALTEENDVFFFGHENSLFGHNRFSTLVFSMKVFFKNLAWNFEEDRYNSAGIEIQAEVS